MKEVSVIWLYGMLALTGVFLTIFWAWKAAARIKSLPAGEWRLDRYLILALALAVFNFGLTVVCGGRAQGNIALGTSPLISSFPGGWVIMTGLAVQLIGCGLMVWLADLEATRHRVWTWGMLAMGIAWLLACMVLKGKI